MSLLKNLKRVYSNIPPEVKLVVVTKRRSVREINQLLFLGVKDLGENRVDEAKEKKPFVKGTAKWHMIGRLQRNKVKDAVKLFDLIQSVDSLKLANKINSVASSMNKKMSILVQVNIGEEPQKQGLLERGLIPFLWEISDLENIQVLGLMAMAPFLDEEETRIYFQKMKSLFKLVKLSNIPNINMKYLSIGMTNDYRVAINEGSNMVRIGTAIFGKHKA